MKVVVDQRDNLASGVVGGCSIDGIEGFGERLDAVLEMA